MVPANTVGKGVSVALGDKLAEVVVDLLSMGLADGVGEAMAVGDGMPWISARSIRGALTRVSSVSGDVAETTMEMAMTPRVPAGTLASAASGSSTESKPDTSSMENTPVTFASEIKYEYVRPGASKSTTEMGKTKVVPGGVADDRETTGVVTEAVVLKTGTEPV